MPEYNVSESSSLQNPDSKQSAWKRCCKYLEFDVFSGFSFALFAFSGVVTLLLVIQINSGIIEVSPNGSVTSDDGVCSEIGVQMIRKGGNAVDAAVASLMCLSVTQPHVVGPGGGGLIMIYDHKKNSSKIFDFMIKYTSSSSTSGIPGFLKGLKHVHRSHGVKSWSSVVQPALNLARNGFIVSEKLKTSVDQESSKFSSELRAQFGTIQKGQLFTRQNYADFLSNVSVLEDEDILYYDPDVAEYFNDSLNNVTESFLDYQVIERNPIQKFIHNISITTVGAPFGGFQVIGGLQLMKELGISSVTQSNELYRAFTKVLQVVKSNTDFFNKSALFSGGSFQDLSRFSASDVYPAAQVAVVDTFDTYVGAVAGLGDAFGSGDMTKTGFIMNGMSSRPTDFSADSFDGRRFSAFAPVVAVEPSNVCGHRVFLASSSWGDVLQTLSQMVFRNLELNSAIKEPRVSLGSEGNILLLNDFNQGIKKLPTAVRKYLKEEGFELQGQHNPSAVDGISKIKNEVMAAADPRLYGKVATINDHPKESEL